MKFVSNRFASFPIVSFLVLSSTTALAVAQTPTLDSEQSAFLTLINNFRSQNGVGPLQVSIALQNSSQWMSNDMATKNYFSHTDSLGRNPFTRMAAFNYPYSPAGENIAAGNSDAQNTFNQWLTACDADASGNCTYAHKVNMLNASYTVMGIGRAYNASSTYRWYWTTDFGGYLDQTLSSGSGTPPPPVNVAPTADSVSPASGSGTTATFTFKYSSANGYSYLSSVYGLVNGSLSGASGCYFQYYAPGRTLYLYNDAGNAVAGTLTPGAGSVVSNSQCTISGSGFTASGSLNQLALTIPVTFTTTFTGSKTLYGYASDQANLNSGWQTLGTWTPAISVSTRPTADSVTPNRGSGSSGTLAFKYSSGKGYSYLSSVYGVINASLSGTNACYFQYYVPGRTLYLYNDALTAVAGTLTPGASTTIGNSQCSISGSGFTASGSGNQLTLTIPVTFSNTFTGVKTVYGYASDQGGLNSGWQVLGNWTH